MTPTPETLRKVPLLQNVKELGEALDAHADAWRQDLENLAVVDAEHAKLTAEVGALRTRLGAAEKLVADTFAYLTKWGELGWMRAADEDEGTNLADRLEDAALAGKETK